LDPIQRDYLKEKPVSDEVFRAYSGLYAYDKGKLDARLEETEETPNWRREKVSFNAAYGGERMAAHLFLPKRAVPPLQAVVYFPPRGARFRDKFDSSFIEDREDFLPKSGRVLVYPIYKGTFERRDGFTAIFKPPLVWRDHMIMWSKDLGRALDYLQTRRDIDSTKLAYSGFSWGAAMAPLLLAVEGRFKTAIVVSGGFWTYYPLPEVDTFNFVAHVKIPVLMLNDRYDSYFPTETSQVPCFRLLGTPDKDKKHVVYDTGHGSLPHTEEIRESLDWLDKYLGPVKRQAERQ
jgi:dienelactone hydrolase